MSENEPIRDVPHIWEIDRGWAVYSAGGDRIGDVADVLGAYIVVEKGFLFKSDLFVPVAAIGGVQPDQVTLTLGKDQIADAGWDRPPIPFGGAAEPPPGLPLAPAPPAPESLSMTGAADERPVPTGEEIDGPLRLEEIRVERVPVSDSDETGRLPEGAFQELDIVIPVRGEVAVASTQPVVREVVRVERVLRPRDAEDAAPAALDPARSRFSIG